MHGYSTAKKDLHLYKKSLHCYTYLKIRMGETMNTKEELMRMNKRYTSHRLKDIKLERPNWLRSGDAIAAVYQEKKVLLQQGNVCYGHIVQANEILFRKSPNIDCPANIIYSTDPHIADNPGLLWEVATNLYRYKNQPLDTVPLQWREMARVITDEMDRSDFNFWVDYNGYPIEFRFLSVMIYRKLLPKRQLCGSLLPVITAPNCQSILTLPKLYWTREFKKLWVRGVI